MRVTILQPNYIPWRGYFDFVKQSDVFVFYDDVQYTKNDWRNRNLIKTKDGVQWLTIPVDDARRMTNKLLIKDAKVVHNDWPKRHLAMLRDSYKNAPYCEAIVDMLVEAFEAHPDSLADLDMAITRKICEYLGFNCKFLVASTLGHTDLAPTERLVAICQDLGATEYLSGYAAKDYLDTSKFGAIGVMWHRYHEKTYPQLHGEFISRISIVDVLMNCGIKTRDII